MSITLRAKRILTGALAGAMVLGLLPAGVASANTDVCDNAGSAGFPDSAGATHQPNVDCMAAYEIISGRDNGTFGGSASITRAQFATLMVNFANFGAGVDLPVVAHPFTDVAEGNVHGPNIARLFGAEIIRGKSDTTFAPSASITRAEAATVLKQAHEALGVDFSGYTAVEFTDVSGIHAANIGLLAAADVVNGTSATTFAPSRNVTRAETASLLKNSADVLSTLNLWTADPLPAAPGATNQTFTVTGGTPYVVATAATTTGTASYSVNVPAGTANVRIELFAAANVNTSTATTTFTQTIAGQAAPATPTNATIVSANGVAVGAAYVNFATSPGTINFIVNVPLADVAGGVTVRPVVWADQTGTGRNADILDINANTRAPLEPFGVGAPTIFGPANAGVAAAVSGATVVLVNKDEGWFTTDAGRYFYFANDAYSRVTTVPFGPISFAEFVAALSPGDGVAIIAPGYNPSSGIASAFTINDVRPALPLVPAAALTGNSGSTFRITNLVSAGARSFNIYRRDFATTQTTCPAVSAGGYTLVGSVAATADPLRFDDASGLAVGRHVCYAVTGVDGTSESQATVQAGSIETVAATADTTAPTATYAAVTTDALLQNVADAGDVWRIIFDEAVVASAAATLRVVETSGNGETFDIVRGGNATMELNSAAVVIGGTSYAAGRVLTVTLTAKPTPVAVVDGGDGEFRYDQTPMIQNAAGIADAAGNAFAPTTTLLARHTTAPAVVAGPPEHDGPLDEGATITLTFDQPVACANDAATRAQFTTSSVGFSAITAVTCNNTTSVVLTGTATGVGVTITYTQSAIESARLTGLNGRVASSPQTSASVTPAAP